MKQHEGIQILEEWDFGRYNPMEAAGETPALLEFMKVSNEINLDFFLVGNIEQREPQRRNRFNVSAMAVGPRIQPGNFFENVPDYLGNL